MYCFVSFIVNKRIQKLALYERSCWILTGFLSVSILMLPGQEARAAVEFETFDESDVSGESSEQNVDELSSMPEIEAEQHDLRLERRRALGVSLGEVMPAVSFAMEYQRHISEHRSVFITLGTGSLTSSSQNEGDDATSNKLNTSAIECGHMWWTSKSFPVASSAFMTAASGDGIAIGTDAPKGRYHVLAVGAGADFKMETLFENGFWLKWSLISLRYLKPVSESHSNIASKNISSMRSRFFGLKLVGITNLAVGYAW